MTSIGESIRDLRLKSGMSQSELAARIGKSRSAVSQYESGEIVPRMGVIETIASIFNVSKSVIIGESEYSRFSPALSSDERSLITLYRNMDAQYRAMLLKSAEAYVGASVKEAQVDGDAVSA